MLSFLAVKPLETFQQCPGFSWHLLTGLQEESMFLQSQKTSMQRLSLTFKPRRYTLLNSHHPPTFVPKSTEQKVGGISDGSRPLQVVLCWLGASVQMEL